MVAWNDDKAIAQDRGSLAFEVYMAQSTPQKTPNQIKAVLPDHLAYLSGLEASGQVLMAGPTSHETGEHMQSMGMLVFRAASMDEARALVEDDPMHKSGARTFTLRKWLVNEGNISLAVGLSSGTVNLS